MLFHCPDFTGWPSVLFSLRKLWLPSQAACCWRERRRWTGGGSGRQCDWGEARRLGDSSQCRFGWVSPGVCSLSLFQIVFHSHWKCLLIGSVWLSNAGFIIEFIHPPPVAVGAEQESRNCVSSALEVVDLLSHLLGLCWSELWIPTSLNPCYKIQWETQIRQPLPSRRLKSNWRNLQTSNLNKGCVRSSREAEGTSGSSLCECKCERKRQS